MFVIIIMMFTNYRTVSCCTNSKKKNSSKALLVLRDSLAELVVVKHPAASILLDLDPPLGWSLGLRDNDGKDTILQAGFDGILIDALRERE